jgi:hypothetical protein
MPRRSAATGLERSRRVVKRSHEWRGGIGQTARHRALIRVLARRFVGQAYGGLDDGFLVVARAPTMSPCDQGRCDWRSRGVRRFVLAGETRRRGE